jgi:hypothetical protein
VELDEPPPQAMAGKSEQRNEEYAVRILKTT